MKTKLSFLIYFVFCLNLLNAQIDETYSNIDQAGANDSIDAIDFTIVEEKPEFPGGDQALLSFIGNNCRYPEAAMKQHIQGKVFVKFVISKDGKVVRPEVVKGVHPLLDEEAVRVIKSLPDWTPGKQKGKNVAVHFIVPINFKLYDDGK
jgi:TonB family protein